MRTSRGFTLIELLVVIAIIAIITALILPDLAGSRPKARDAQRVSDISQLQLALELYFDRCGQYPSSLTTSASCTTSIGTVTLGTYISQIPLPPAGTTQAAYDYGTFTVSGQIVNYVLQAILESTNPDVSKGLNYSSISSSGGSWSSGFSTTFANCSNAAGSKDYCVEPQ